MRAEIRAQLGEFTFNRTIVELKFTFCIIRSLVSFTFNRTIVELKYEGSEVYPEIEKLLIVP